MTAAEKCGLYFAPLCGGVKTGLHDFNTKTFKGNKQIAYLSREMCQNALDNADGSGKPVRVVFNRQDIETNKHLLFEQFLDGLKRVQDHWKDKNDTTVRCFLKDAEFLFKSDEISFLTISDYNTTGASTDILPGQICSSWEALSDAIGLTTKTEGTTGGSHGLGKNAAMACSRLNLVFIHTRTSKTPSLFSGLWIIGTIGNTEEEKTQGIVKYWYLPDKNFKFGRAIREYDENSFRDLFKRNIGENGTDIIIAAFEQTSNWTKYVKNAVLENFFVAIKEKNLIVEIVDGTEHIIIDDSSLQRLFEEYASKDNKKTPSIQFYKTLIEPTATKKLTIKEKDDCEVYIKFSDKPINTQIYNYRRGMYVGTLKINKPLLYQPYTALVVIRGKNLGKILVGTEPPAHDTWDSQRVENEEEREIAIKTVEELENKVKEFLNSFTHKELGNRIDPKSASDYLPDDSKSNPFKHMPDFIKKTIKPIDKTDILEIGQDDSDSSTQESTNSSSTNNFDDNGNLILQESDFSKSRILPTHQNPGEYRIILKPKDNHQNVFIELWIINESKQTKEKKKRDEDENLIEIISCKDINSGKELSIADKKAGPFSLQANILTEFMAIINDNNETLSLGTKIIEEVNTWEK